LAGAFSFTHLVDKYANPWEPYARAECQELPRKSENSVFRGLTLWRTKNGLHK
jgi:hypothetical protein